MRHHVHTFKIGRKSGHIRSLLANAVCSLVEHRRITTTLVKAKEIRRYADKAVTLAKQGTLHARRIAIARLHQPETVKTLFDVIAPQFKERNGGYTRIMKLGPRRGDGAEMAIIEFVESDEVVAARKNAAEAAEAAPKAEEAKAEN